MYGFLLLLVASTLVAQTSCRGEESDRPPSAEREVQKQRRIREWAEEDAEVIDSAADLERRKAHLCTAVYRRIRVRQGLPSHIRSIKLSQNHGRESFSLHDYSREEQQLIVLAGKLRADCCTDLLLNRISQRWLPAPWGEPQEAWGMESSERYPALEALALIGQPACQRTLNRIVLEQDRTAREKMTWLLGITWGREEAKTQLGYLQKTLTDEEELQRVAEAVQQLDDENR